VVKVAAINGLALTKQKTIATNIHRATGASSTLVILRPKFFARQYPNGPSVEVVLGAPADTILDVTVTLNSLTIQTNGALSTGRNVRATTNLFDFQGDGSLLGGGSGYITIPTGGTLVKSGGPGTFDFGSNPSVKLLSGHSATIVVKSGTLAFPQGNNDTDLNGGGTFAISNNATLVPAQDINTGTSLIGDFTEVGGGTVLLNAGNLISFPGPGYSLDFSGNMFQWTGGGAVQHLSRSGQGFFAGRFMAQAAMA